MYKYVVEMTNNMHKFLQLPYSMYRLLHVSAVVCHNQGASGSVVSYMKIHIDLVVYHIMLLSGRSVVVP
jgi:hypothetical protein